MQRNQPSVRSDYAIPDGDRTASLLPHHQSPKSLEMFGAAEPMITWNEVQVEWKAGMSAHEFVGELSTPVWSNDSVVLTMQNRGFHTTNDIKRPRPMLLAFFYPLPGQRPVSM